MNSPLHPRQTPILTPLLVCSAAAALALTGCSVATTTTQTASATPSANWQIQAGSAITSPPTYPYFTGAVQVQGTQGTATFSSASQSGATPQVLTFAGSVSSTNGNLLLLSNLFDIGFTAPATPNTIVPVTVTGGCVGPDPVCTAVFEVPSVGVEIAPVNGTYTGTLASGGYSSGTATLTLTQSPTPNSNGAFPLTGTMTFPASGFPGTYPVAGTVSGEGITLNPVTPPGFYISASTNPAATQIDVARLIFGGGGIDPALTFTGTLTLQ